MRSGPIPLGHAEPVHPPVQAADVPLLESDAHVALLAGSMNQFVTVHDGGTMGAEPDAETVGLMALHRVPQAAWAICCGDRGSAFDIAGVGVSGSSRTILFGFEIPASTYWIVGDEQHPAIMSSTRARFRTDFRYRRLHLRQD